MAYGCLRAARIALSPRIPARRNLGAPAPGTCRGGAGYGDAAAEPRVSIGPWTNGQAGQEALEYRGSTARYGRERFPAPSSARRVHRAVPNNGTASGHYSVGRGAAWTAGCKNGGGARLSQWLERAETLWNENGRGRRSFLEQYDYFGQLSKQFPIAAIRVVYTKAGTNLAAAAVRDETAIIDHKLYWAAAVSPEEACYLCGILNSEALRAGVEQFQSQGQWGARDFDKYVFNLPIPKFDGNNPLHRELARLARTAEEVAETVSEEEGEYFTRTRRRVRSALTEHGIAAKLERLTEKLLERSPDL